MKRWEGEEGESLLAQMLLVMVVLVAQTLPPPSAAETGFLHLRARRKYFLRQSRHAQQQKEFTSVFKLELGNTLYGKGRLPS